MIPDKNLFIVTSCIKPVIGVFSEEVRFLQTIVSLMSIREKDPDAIIFLCDASVNKLTEKELDKLNRYCNLFIDMNNFPHVRELSSKGLKSHAENALMFGVLASLKQGVNSQKMMYSVKRIFKYSARTNLNENFRLEDYDNLFGKFVFKKRIPTWMQNVQNDATNLLITRLFSFCPSLIDVYLNVINENFRLLNYMDTEHAHFVNIPKKYLVEFDNIGCVGFLAGNGATEVY